MIDMPDDGSPDAPATLDALELCVLGSGSGGNCSVLRSPGGAMMIDCGLGPRVVGRRLHAAADRLPVAVDDVTAVCLTHLDHDHFNPNWVATLAKREIAVWCHASRADDVRYRAGRAIDVRTFECGEAFEPVPGVRVRAVACAHDREGSHAFRLDGFGGSIGYATDLGHVPAGLLDAFCNVDLLAIESNYDRQMQVDSPRPFFLKSRIMNGSGHLSNAEAYAAVRELFDRCERSGKCGPRHVVLLHRSRECNCPDLLRKFFGRDRRIGRRLTLSHQDEPTSWLRAGPGRGEQLMLAWG
jgi:phosphoribosyl 1,2-cyclic phosphodiesterase